MPLSWAAAHTGRAQATLLQGTTLSWWGMCTALISKQRDRRSEATCLTEAEVHATAHSHGRWKDQRQQCASLARKVHSPSGFWLYESVKASLGSEVLRACLHTPWLCWGQRKNPKQLLLLPWKSLGGTGREHWPPGLNLLPFCVSSPFMSQHSLPASQTLSEPAVSSDAPGWLTVKARNVSARAPRRSGLGEGPGRQSGELWKGNMQNYLENLLLTTLFCWQQRYETGTKELKNGEKQGETISKSKKGDLCNQGTGVGISPPNMSHWFQKWKAYMTSYEHAHTHSFPGRGIWAGWNAIYMLPY